MRPSPPTHSSKHSFTQASINPPSIHAPAQASTHPCTHRPRPRACTHPTLHLPMFLLICPSARPYTHQPSLHYPATPHLDIHAPIYQSTYPSLHLSVPQVLRPSLQERDGHGPPSRPALSQHRVATIPEFPPISQQRTGHRLHFTKEKLHLNIKRLAEVTQQASKPTPLPHSLGWLARS